MSMTTLELREALCAHGYARAVIPCDGKAPTLANWQGPVSTDAYSMARWRGLNTGLKTAFNPVIDIDIMDPDAADVAEGTIRGLFRQQGRDPRPLRQAPQAGDDLPHRRPVSKNGLDLRGHPR